MRLRGAKTEMKKAGESTDGMAESVSKLREQFKALSGVDIMKDGGKSFKSTYEIFDELSQVWGSLSDIAKANITELAAGKNRGNLFSSLMGTDGSGFETARRTLEEAKTSAGVAEKELGKASDSIEFKVRQLKGTLQELSTEFISSDAAKGFLDTINGISTAITKITGSVGGLKTALLGIVAVWTTISTLRTNSSWLKTDQNLGTQFKSIGSSIKNATLNFTSGASARASQGYTYKQYVGNDAYEQQVAQRNALATYAKEYQRTGDMAGSMQKLQGMPNIVKQYAAQMDNLGESSKQNVAVMNQFNDSLKQSGVAMVANGKSLSSMTNTVKAFNSGAINAQQISAANAQWGKYFSGIQQGEASVSGLIVKMTALKAASVAASIGITALNTAFSMGIALIASFAISKIIEGIDSVVHAAENAREKAQDSLSNATNSSQNTTQAISDYEALKKQYQEGSATKAQLETGTQSYLSSLGMEDSQIQSLIEKYGSLSEAMKNYKEWKDDIDNNTINNNLNDANTAVNDAKNALKKTAKSTSARIKVGTNVSETFSTSELESLGLREYSSGGFTKTNLDYSIDRKNLNNTQSIYKVYEKLLKKRNELIDKYSISDLTGKDKGTKQGRQYSVLNSLLGSETDEDSLAYQIKQLQDAQKVLNTIASTKALNGQSFKSQKDFNKYIDEQIKSNKDLVGTEGKKRDALLQTSKLYDGLSGYADGYNQKLKELNSSNDKKVIDFEKITIPQSAIDAYDTYANAIAKSGASSKEAQAAYASLQSQASAMGVTIDALTSGISRLDTAWNKERSIVESIAQQNIGETGKQLQKDFDEWYDKLSQSDQIKIGNIFDNVTNAGIDTSTWGVEGWKEQLKNVKKYGKDIGQIFTEAKDTLYSTLNDTTDADGKTVTSWYTQNVDSLVTSAQSLDTAIDNIGSGKADPLQISEYLRQAPEAALATGNLVDSLEAVKQQQTDSALAAIDDKINELSKDSPAAAEGLRKIRDEIEKGLTGDYIDIDNVTSDISNAYNALQSSFSATGMDNSNIYNLQKMFKGVGANTNDWDAIFDKTNQGVHLNVQAFNEWISKYSEVKKQAAADNLQNLEQQYDALSEKIKNCSDASEKAELQQEQWNLTSQIQDAATLCSQLDALTGAYERWQNAQSAGNQGDNFTSFGSKWKDIEEDYNNNKTNSNEFRAYADMLMYGDQTNASQAEVTKGFKAFIKNNGALKNFMQDASLNNFTKAMERLQQVSQKAGESWVTKNSSGGWDVNIDDADAFAKALGVDVQYLNLLIGQMQEFGNVNVFGEYDNELQKFNQSETEAFKTLQSLTGEGQKLAGMSDTIHSIQIGSGDETTVNSSYSAAEDVLSRFRDSEGKIDLKVEGAAEAESIFQQLYIEKQNLTPPLVMQVDTSQLDKGEQDIVTKTQTVWTNLQQIKADLNGGLSLNDSQVKTDVNTLKTSIQELSNLNIPDGLKEKLSGLLNFSGGDTSKLSGEVANLDSYLKQLDGIKGKDYNIKFKANTDKVDDKDFDKNAKVHYKPVGVPKDYSEELNRKAHLQYDVNVSEVVTSSDVVTTTAPTTTTGTGKSKGKSKTTKTTSTKSKKKTKSKAYGGGFKSSGTALGGELGVELVASKDGYARLVGEQGAELFNYKSGDIVFTHEQTEEILKRGWTEGRGTIVGKAYAEGYNSSGVGNLGGNKSTSTKKNSKDKSNSKSKDKSSSDTSKAAKDASSAVQDTSQTIQDWIERLIKDIENSISRIEKSATDSTQFYSQRIADYGAELDMVKNEYEVQKQAAAEYLAAANAIPIDDATRQKIYHGDMSIEYTSGTSKSSDTTDGDVSSSISNIQGLYDKYQDALDKQIDLQQKINTIYENIFTLTESYYDNLIDAEEVRNKRYESSIKNGELRGYLTTPLNYSGEYMGYQVEQKLYHQQSVNLTNQLTNMINNGNIKKGSEEYYELLNKVNTAKQNEFDAINNAQEALNNMREAAEKFANWQYEQNNNVKGEVSTYNELFQSRDMYYGDKDRSYHTGIEPNSGQLNMNGLASATWIIMQQGIDIKQMQQLQSAIQNAKKQIYNSDGTINTEALSSYQELLSKQQDVLKNIEDEKQAIVDLVKNGIELELDALQKRINAYEEALDEQKSLYDYQKKLSEQTEALSETQKIRTAYTGDTSQETMLKRQELSNQQKEQQENIEDTEYEQYISDQKDMLSQLYEEYTDVLNSTLYDINGVLQEVRDDVEANKYDTATYMYQMLEKADGFGNSYIEFSDGVKSFFDQFADKYLGGDNSGADANSAGKILGDVNGDGSIDSSDATEILKKYSEALLNGQSSADIDVALGDVNGDGVVDSTDATKILQVFAEALLNNADVDSSIFGNGNNLAAQNTSPSNTTGSMVETLLSGIGSMYSEIWAQSDKQALDALYGEGYLNATNGDVTNSQYTEKTAEGIETMSGKLDDWFNSGYPSFWRGDGKSMIGEIADDTQLDVRAVAANTHSIGSVLEQIMYNTANISSLSGGSYMYNTEQYYYAKGTKKIKQPQLAWTQERHKQEAIVKPDGSILTPLAKGDAVLNHKDTSTIWNFAENPTKFIQDNLSTENTAVVPQTSVNTNNTNNIQMSLNLPNVSNYSDFVNELKNDSKFESMIQDMTVGRLNGKSKLAKNRYRW